MRARTVVSVSLDRLDRFPFEMIAIAAVSGDRIMMMVASWQSAHDQRLMKASPNYQ